MRRSPESSLHFDRWPEADRHLWATTMEGGSLFGDGPLSSELSDASRRGRRNAYSALLGFVACHRAERLLLPPLSRVDHDLVVDYINYLRETRSDVSIAIDLERVYLVLVAFGATDVVWLRKLQRRVARATRPKALPPVTGDELYHLGMDLMDRAVAESDANGSVFGRQRKMYRDGMMIAFLAAIPIRRRSLACLRVGIHLRKIGNLWKLNVPEADTKTGVAVIAPSP